jgi:hypothetical protein
MKTKSVSDGYLMQMWRKAVLNQYNNKCFRCGKTEELECHHFIKRRHKLLRWNWRNGIPGCHDCHKFYHTKIGENWISDRIKFYIYLLHSENLIYKQYLIDNNLTDNEFRNKILADLKEAIK